MSRLSALNPNRYLWLNGLPAFDLLFNSGASIENQFADRFLEKFRSSDLPEISAKLDRIRLQQKELECKIKSWKNRISSRSNAEENLQKLIAESILSGKDEAFLRDLDLGQTDRIDELTLWADSAHKALRVLADELRSQTSLRNRRFTELLNEITAKIQADEINPLVLELDRKLLEFDQAAADVAAEFGFSGSQRMFNLLNIISHEISANKLVDPNRLLSCR